jgi:hypothetical protein
MTFTTSTNHQPMPEQPTKRPRRSRVTSDPIRARHKATTSRGLRVRDLFRAFMAKLDADDVVAQAAALRAAELTVTAEDIRGRITAGDFDLAEQLVRVENMVERATRAVAKLAEAKPAGPSLADVWTPYDGKQRPYEQEQQP